MLHKLLGKWRYVLKKDFILFDELANGEPEKNVLTDTLFIKTVVFAARAGIEMGPGVESWIQSKRYLCFDYQFI